MCASHWPVSRDVICENFHCLINRVIAENGGLPLVRRRAIKRGFGASTSLDRWVITLATIGYRIVTTLCLGVFVGFTAGLVCASYLFLNAVTAACKTLACVVL